MWNTRSIVSVWVGHVICGDYDGDDDDDDDDDEDEETMTVMVTISQIFLVIVP